MDVRAGLKRKLSTKELTLLWCWRRLLEVPWTARRSNQSILKEISPGCSLEGLMLKLKLQYFGHLMRRVDSLEKTLMLGGIGGRKRRGPQRMRWLDGITDYGHGFEQALGFGDEQGSLACCSPWGCKESDMTEQLNWGELSIFSSSWEFNNSRSTATFFFFLITAYSFSLEKKFSSVFSVLGKLYCYIFEHIFHYICWILSFKYRSYHYTVEFCFSKLILLAFYVNILPLKHFLRIHCYLKLSNVESIFNQYLTSFFWFLNHLEFHSNVFCSFFPLRSVTTFFI